MDLFRNATRNFLCPVTGCEASYTTGPDLQLHINHQHVFLTSALQPAILQMNQSSTRPQSETIPFPSPQQAQGVANAYNVQPTSLTHAQQRELIAQAFDTVVRPSDTARPAREIPHANSYNAAPRPLNTTQRPQPSANPYNAQAQPPNQTQRPQPIGITDDGRYQLTGATQQRHQRPTSNPVDVHRTQASNYPQQAHQRQHSNPAQTTWTQPPNTAQQVQQVQTQQVQEQHAHRRQQAQQTHQAQQAYQAQQAHQAQQAQPAHRIQQAPQTQPSIAPQEHRRAPQVYPNPSQPPVSPRTGMHPPLHTRNQSSGSTDLMFANDPTLNIMTVPVTHPSSISQGQPPNNNQSLRCVWPNKAESLLKTLILRHSLFALPLEKIDRPKFRIVVKEFAETFGLDFMNMGSRDRRILTIFENKVIELQHIIKGETYEEQMRQKREAARRQQLNDAPMSFTTSDHPMNQPTVLSPIATPPPTPIISHAPKQITIKDCWDSRNAEDQIKIFFQLIQSAKNPDRMALVWEKWNENRKKKRRASDVFGQGLVIERHFESISNQTPSFTPPVEDQAKDLDSMIEKEVREARLKRQREKEMNEMKADQKAEEEPSAKRLKISASNAIDLSQTDPDKAT